MAHFSYDARSRTGERFAGIVEAASRREAAHKLRQRGLWVAALTLRAPGEQPDGQVRTYRGYRAERLAEDNATQRQAERGNTGRGTRLGRFMLRRPLFHPVSGRRACVLFLRQLSLLQAAGLPLHEALGALQAEGPSRASQAGRRECARPGPYEEMVGTLRATVLSGQPLSEALLAYPTVFPRSVCQLIALGEVSGSLSSILPELADHMELAMKTRAKLRAAMAYPVLLLIVTLAAGAFLTVFLLPAFAALLTSLSADLPWPTRILLGLSSFLQQYGVVLALLFAGLTALAGCLFRRPGPRGWLDHSMLRLPFSGSLLCYGEWQTILSLLAILLQHGVPLDRALSLAREVPDNAYLRSSLQDAHARLCRGSSLTAALGRTILPPFLMPLLQAGEAAGRLEEMMARGASLAQFCYEEKLRRLEILVEPVLTIAVGSLIFFFVLGIILPLLTTMDALG